MVGACSIYRPFNCNQWTFVLYAGFPRRLVSNAWSIMVMICPTAKALAVTCHKLVINSKVTICHCVWKPLVGSCAMYKILSFSLNRWNENADNLSKRKIPLFILLKHQFQFNKIHILSFSDFIENQQCKHGGICIIKLYHVCVNHLNGLCLG